MTQKKKIFGIILSSVAAVTLAIFIGGNLYMTSKENAIIDKESADIAIERKAALEIKSLFKNIKVIKMTELSESSPHIKNVDFDVIDLEGNTIKGNSTTVGESGSYSENGLTPGSTDGKVKVIYTTGDEEMIK